MKNRKNQIWIGTDQLENSPEYRKATDSEQGAPARASVTDSLDTAAEASENPRLESSRRDFLKYLGFGMTAATIASCDIPVRKAIPYVSKPDTIVPGVASYFASTFVQGGDYVPVLVKTREGRPIKIEGNSMCPITNGGTSARAQASVLSMYDTSRFDGPRKVNYDANQEAINATGISWGQVDAEIRNKMRAGAQVRIVSHTIMSPSLHTAIQDFKAKYPNTALVQYDPISYSALLDANEQSFGVRAIPSYRFDEAEVIVAINCDFLGTWISPIQYAKDYVGGRDFDPNDNNPRSKRHIQVESHMSLTGSNADNRIQIKPSQTGEAIRALYNAIVGGGGNPTGLDEKQLRKLTTVANELRGARGRALVVSGSNNLGEQLLVNAINNALGSYGSTIRTDRWSLQRQGSDQDLKRFADELESGNVDAVIVLDGANPAYDNYHALRIAAALPSVPLRISTNSVPNETSTLCEYITPTHNFLESWGDVEPVQGHYSLIQPAIVPIFASVNRDGTRQEGESLLIWGDSARYDSEASQPYLDFVQSNWRDTAFGAQTQFTSFNSFWDSALHDGILQTDASGGVNSYGTGYADVGRVNTTPGRVTAAPVVVEPGVDSPDSAPASAPFTRARVYSNRGLTDNSRRLSTVLGEDEITFYETVNMGSGYYANNPWLQEVPDPVTRTVWGNYLAIPVTYEGGNSYTAYNDLNAEEYKGRADKVDVTVGDVTQLATAVRQFGQMPGTFSLALGYGRSVTGQPGRALGENIGINVYPWLWTDDQGYVQYYGRAVAVSEAVDVEEEFPSVQYHHTMGLTMRDESGSMRYYNTRTGEELVLDRELTEEEKEYIEPFHVDEKTVMELGSGMQGGLTKRSIIFQGSMSELPALREEIAERRAEAQHLNEQTLYPYEEYVEDIYSQGHWWAMHVDLNKCIGCAACEVACVAENNVQVVGKYEVWRHHEMKWLRIDRYFYGDVENPKAVYQPMMCQHCDNAPCENVCPVNASQHSNEGLNQMIYNRCIGTRYCANNCPYKVRRFNWLDFSTADLFSTNEPELNGEELPFGADNLTRMVLNPDVTVRSRGVIEKCSFCTQRLQSGKLTAKVEGRRLRDSDVRTACQTACPTGAITFGDRNNRGRYADVSAKLQNPLNYLVLEETNTQSAVFYAARVNNSLEELEA